VLQRRVAGVVQNDSVRGRCGGSRRLSNIAAAVDDGHGVLFERGERRLRAFRVGRVQDDMRFSGRGCAGDNA